MIEDLGRNKSIFVFFVIIGCFAVLWPQVLYPIITNMGNTNIQPNQFDKGVRNPRFRTGKAHPAFKTIPDLVVPPRKSQGASKRPPVPGPERYLKQNEPNSMGMLGFLMPIYTFALVVFSVYAGIKTFFRNQNNTYPTSLPDADFRREIFLQNADQSRRQSVDDNQNHLVIDSKKIDEVEDLTELRTRLRDTEVAMEQLIQKINAKFSDNSNQQNRSVRFDNEDTSVKVIGLQSSVNKTNQEPFNSDEDSKSDMFPDPFKKYPDKGDNQTDLHTPKILLDDMPISSHVQVLVTDTVTNNDSNNNTMVLSSKMTLSVISNSDEENDKDEDQSANQEVSKYSTSSLHTAIDYLNVNDDTEDEVEEVSDEE